MMIMSDDLATKIEALFERCPALCGFSVRDPADIPDSCARSDAGRPRSPSSVTAA